MTNDHEQLLDRLEAAGGNGQRRELGRALDLSCGERQQLRLEEVCAEPQLGHHLPADAIHVAADSGGAER